jgi:hypothetical protein
MVERWAGGRALSDSWSCSGFFRRTHHGLPHAAPAPAFNVVMTCWPSRIFDSSPFIEFPASQISKTASAAGLRLHLHRAVVFRLSESWAATLTVVAASATTAITTQSCSQVGFSPTPAVRIRGKSAQCRYCPQSDRSVTVMISFSPIPLLCLRIMPSNTAIVLKPVKRFRTNSFALLTRIR